jgi:hypothetical protein
MVWRKVLNFHISLFKRGLRDVFDNKLASRLPIFELDFAEERLREGFSVVAGENVRDEVKSKVGNLSFAFFLVLCVKSTKDIGVELLQALNTI